MKLRELWKLFLVEDVQLITGTSESVELLWQGRTNCSVVFDEVEQYLDREVRFVHCLDSVQYVYLSPKGACDNEVA